MNAICNAKTIHFLERMLWTRFSGTRAGYRNSSIGVAEALGVPAEAQSAPERSGWRLLTHTPNNPKRSQ
jgi:hypothetical protein